MADIAAKAGGEVIEVGNQFYILATASRAAERTAVLAARRHVRDIRLRGRRRRVRRRRARAVSRGNALSLALHAPGQRQASAHPQLARQGRQRAVRRRPDEPRHPDRPNRRGDPPRSRAPLSLALSLEGHVVRADPPVELQPGGAARVALVRVRLGFRGHLRGARHAASEARRAVRDRTLRHGDPARLPRPRQRDAVGGDRLG